MFMHSDIVNPYHSSSPLSVSSHTSAKSGSVSSISDEFLTAKTSGGTPTSVNKAKTPKVVNTNTMLALGMVASYCSMYL